MNDFIELRKVIAITLRWWWLLALATGAGLGVGYGVSAVQEPVFEATTTLLVGQSIQSAQLDTRDIAASEQLARTYAQIARLQPILQEVVEALDLPVGWQALASRVRVSPVEATQLLKITAEAGSPAEAQRIADKIAETLILRSPDGQQSQAVDNSLPFMTARLADLQTNIEKGQQRVTELEAAVLEANSAEKVESIQRELNTVQNLIIGWESNYTQLLTLSQSGGGANSLTVVEPAQADLSPIRPRTALNMLLLGVVGAGLALGAIFLLEQFDNRVRTADDLKLYFGQQPLGTIGKFKESGHAGKLISSRDPSSAIAEAYRMIRTNILFMSPERQCKSILFTSPSTGEGKSYTVANLAITMAQAGMKTIIVDANLRNPMQNEIFYIPHVIGSHAGGLTELLYLPEIQTEMFLRNVGVPNLQVLTSGAIPPNPAELLGSKRMDELLCCLSKQAEIVLIDSPAAVSVTDAAVLANRVDGVVMVAKASHTRRNELEQAIQNVQKADAKFLGVVLSQV
ncbi:MAG: polysaccharide biosynthesis tyrosine autokinase [Caldilineaceae bacterium]